MCTSDHGGRKVAVLGMGNLLMTDEGIGVHVIRELESGPDIGPVRLVDGGTSPDAIDLVADVDYLIVVDAGCCGGPPGAVYRLEPDLVEPGGAASIHDLSIIDMMWSMRMWGTAPEVVVFAVEPRTVDWGMELSPELKQKLPRIVDQVRAEVRSALG